MGREGGRERLVNEDERREIEGRRKEWEVGGWDRESGRGEGEVGDRGGRERDVNRNRVVYEGLLVVEVNAVVNGR